VGRPARALRQSAVYRRSQLGTRSATNVPYALGARDAIGFSPFSLESVKEPAPHPSGQSYRMISQIAPLIVEHQGRGTMAGVTVPVAFDDTSDNSPQRVTPGGSP
jgi:hypothetical protein